MPTTSSCMLIFSHSDLNAYIKHDRLRWPGPEPMTNDNELIPYFLVGDDAFSLMTWLMKPYSRRGLTVAERTFNYRISRVKRMVENPFGLLVQVWCCLLKIMELAPAMATTVTCIVLHNLLQDRFIAQHQGFVDRVNRNGNIVSGVWKRGLSLWRNEAKLVHETVKEHFMPDAGAVEWQRRLVLYKFENDSSSDNNAN